MQKRKEIQRKNNTIERIDSKFWESDFLRYNDVALFYNTSSMKQSFLYGSVMLLMIPQTFVMATESVTNSAPPFSNTPASTTDANYWLQQKAIMQQKSSEMRQKKYEELKAKGVDVSLLASTVLDATKTDESTFWSVMKQIQQAQETQSRKEYIANLTAKGTDTSSISSDLLDATKTDSTTFWNAMKHLQQAKEIASRKEYLAKLAAQGYDISVFTDAIIADGTAFWETAKKVQSSKNSSRTENPGNGNPPPPRNDAERLGSNSGTSANPGQEISTRRKIVAELQANGIDTSVFTEEVLADGNRFWKYVESLKKAKAASGMTLSPKKDDRPPQIGNEMDHPTSMTGQKDRNE